MKILIVNYYARLSSCDVPVIYFIQPRNIQLQYCDVPFGLIIHYAIRCGYEKYSENDKEK